MGPVQTLHEFALNLLSDPQALADFNADPQAVLSAVGLADVSAADVHEIIPLVMDLAPTSVTDSFGSAGDVTGVLDSGVIETAHGLVDNVTHDATGAFVRATDTFGPVDTIQGTVAEAAAPLSDVLNSLPNLSGVFGAVSDVAEQTGLNTVTHEALDTVSGVVDNVADAVAGVPIVGPVLEAGAIDLENTVGALGDHLWDGQLVGSAVDAVTNHLGDALLPVAVVDTVSELPVVGEPVGGLLEDVRIEGGALLGAVNTAIGSTPVGVESGDLLSNLLSGDLSDVTTAANTVTDSVSANLGNVPVVGGVVAGVADTASGVLNTAADTGSDFASTGDLSGTLDHVTAALPAAPNIPVVGDVVGGLTANAPVVTDVVSSVTSTVGGAAAGVPVVGDVVSTVSDVHVTDVTSTVTTTVHSVAGGVTDNLNIGHVTDVADVAGTDSGLLGDHLHLGL